jgi:hypothetical protein
LLEASHHEDFARNVAEQGASGSEFA